MDKPVIEPLTSSVERKSAFLARLNSGHFRRCVLFFHVFRPLNNLLKNPAAILLACKTICLSPALSWIRGHTLGGLAKALHNSCRWNPCMAVNRQPHTEFWKVRYFHVRISVSEIYKTTAAKLQINEFYNLYLFLTQTDVVTLNAYNPDKSIRYAKVFFLLKAPGSPRWPWFEMRLFHQPPGTNSGIAFRDRSADNHGHQAYDVNKLSHNLPRSQNTLKYCRTNLDLLSERSIGEASCDKRRKEHLLFNEQNQDPIFHHVLGRLKRKLCVTSPTQRGEHHQFLVSMQNPYCWR